MATKSIAWDTGGGYIRLTYSGSGNGTISVESDANTLGTSRSKTITVQTVGGAVTKNLTVSQAACPFPVGEIRNYSYTGSYQEVELPAGKYKLQCWGAQGGSNGTNSSYGITANAGGKGGYSEGVITLSQKTTVRVYVGGQGSASAGGFNGGGSTTGTAQYDSGDTFGYSKMGGGGGATDIRLSDGALLSRMIVAGGGSGGAMCYKKVTSSEYQRFYDGEATGYVQDYYYNHYIAKDIPVIGGRVYYAEGNTTSSTLQWEWQENAGASYSSAIGVSAGNEVTAPSGANYVNIYFYCEAIGDISGIIGSFSKIDVFHFELVTTVTEDWDSQVGYVGGGTNGAGYSSTYQGKQNAAGSGGSFGQGANQTTTNYRYASGAGGGGWYGGGGGKYSDSDMSTLHYSGGGSGWVNIAANAGNRPSGYTGIELDSGTTYAGNTSFPSTGGGTETGHSGNGYARITRLE